MHASKAFDVKRTSKLQGFVLGLALSAMAMPSLHAAPPQGIGPRAASQINAIDAIKRAKTPVQGKISSRLFMGLLHQRKDPRLASLTTYRFVTPEKDGRVPVDIVLNGKAALKPVSEALESLHGKVLFASRTYNRIHARVRLEDLETLAARSDIRAIRQHMPAIHGKMDTSEGDATHGGPTARAYYGTTGSGVKVCVMSDGVDSLTQVQSSGDLPAIVDVLPGQEGSGDEGTAMLEIVHDLAPGAELGFATAFTSEASFAQNIISLAIDGCNIIVDDIIYLDESPFEDGPVAQAVNTVTNAGVLYFSSAGNEGNHSDGTSGTWEGDFKASAATPPTTLPGMTLHDFGDGGNAITVTGGGSQTPPVLIWAEHYDFSTGNASTDYDLYDLSNDLSTVYDSSTDTQDGAGGDDYPIEFLGSGAYGDEKLVVVRKTTGTTTSAPMFNLIVFRGTLDQALATNGATRGHSAAEAAFSVAATPAAGAFDAGEPSGPYPGLFDSSAVSESFSSDGPRRIILDGATGEELTASDRTSSGGVVRQKPDITAADGVSVATPGYSPFFGTSAAAPHAAAIAALLKSAVPTLTPVAVRTALTSTAIDIEALGVDQDSGAGIVMPGAALAAVGATPRAALSDGTAAFTQVSGDGDSAVEPGETYSIQLPLTNNGGAGATAISATLGTASAGVTLVQATSSYPDLAISATASNATPFEFAVGPTATCGRSIAFTLTVTYSGGAGPQSFDFSVPTGADGTPVVTSYTGPVVAIPDGTSTPAIATLPVAGMASAVKSLTFSIDGATCSTAAGATTVGLDHSYVSDLQLTLTSPTGTSVLLAGAAGGSGNNFCQTVLDDTASTSIQAVTSSQAPFTGSFRPNQPLSTFVGELADGNWQFQAVDLYAEDSGNIRAFSLSITPAVCDAVSDVIFANGFE